VVEYTHIRIFTSEKARHEGKSVSQAVVHYLHDLKIAARCSVFRGYEGLYETGELSTDGITDLSYNLPIVIDVLVPAHEADTVHAYLKSVVSDGFIGVQPMAFAAARPEGNLLPRRLLVKDLMSAPPSAAHLDFSVRTALELMLDRGLKALPVVDDKAVPIGIVTTQDLLRAGMPVRTGLLSELPEPERNEFLDKASRLTVPQIMTRHPVTVVQTAPISRAVQLMVERGHKRLPVVDEHKRLVGVISRIDVLRAVSSELPSRQQVPTKSSASVVRDVARLDAIPVPAQADLMTAVDILVKQDEERTAVVDVLGRVVGVISDRELFEALGRRGFSAPRKTGGASRTAAEVMKPDTSAVDIDASVEDALRVMVEHGLKRLAVVENGRFAGMLRRDNLLAALSRHL